MADWTLRKQQRRYTIPCRDILILMYRAKSYKNKQANTQISNQEKRQKACFSSRVVLFFLRFEECAITL